MELYRITTPWTAVLIIFLLLVIVHSALTQEESRIRTDNNSKHEGHEVKRSRRTKSKPEILEIQIGGTGNEVKQQEEAVVPPCPMGCRCTAGPRLHARHHWHRILGAYRTHRLVYGPGREDFNYLPQRNPHRPSGREMVCVGLPDMPDFLPSDVSRVVFYGSMRETWEEQKDDPADEPDDMVNLDSSVESSFPNALHQLTSVSKLNVIRSESMRYLEIQGNRIKVLYPSDFEMLSSLRHLHINNNRMKVVSVGAFKGLDHVQDIDLSENHIRHLPNKIFKGLSNLRKINLSKNRLQLLHEKVFAGVDKLHHLDLSFNYITDMPKDIFLNSHKMKSLILSDNQLRQIRSEWIGHMKKLQKLDLKGNKIHNIDDNTFSTLANLKTLNLDKNQLKELRRQTFSGLSNLNTLYLGNNNISFIHNQAFVHLSQLRELHLHHNHIDTVNADTLFGLGSLQKLSLAHNRLGGIGREAFVPVQKLQHLDMAHNKIKIITNRNFYGLLDLRELRLEHNEIRSVQDDGFAVSIVNTFSKMTWLHLSFNELSTITRRMFTGLAYLKFLNLGHNQIEIVDESGLAVFNRLNSIILNDNQLYDILPATFKQLSHLRLLNLGSNKLRHIRFNAFLGLDSIEELSLQNNDVSSIDTGVFLDTPNLRSLNLRKNRMNFFNLNILDRLPRLKYLDLAQNTVRQLRIPSSPIRRLFSMSLADNYLQKLSVNVTDVVSKRGALLLYGNPWNCNCDLEWLLGGETINNVHIVNADQIVCKSPGHLSGEKIQALSHEDFCPQQDLEYVTDTTADVLRTKQSIACSFSELPEGLGRKSETKSHKKEPLRWVMNFFNNDDNSWMCTGIRLHRNYVLTHSSCWKNNLGSGETAVKATIGSARLGDNLHSVEVKEVQHYNGPLDFALVKTTEVKEGSKDRVFPCILDPDGLSAIMAKTSSTHAIIVSTTENRNEIKVRPLITKTIGQPCVEGYLCLSVNKDQYTVSRYQTDFVPSFFKVGRSRWALGSIGELKAYRNVLTTPLTKLIPWIDTIIE